MTDFALGTTFDVKFTTRRFTTGAPFALAGGVIAAYPDNSVTQLTAGITLSADFDGVTGLNNIRVVATSGNGYAAGSSYALVITTGTVDSVSVVGEVVEEFTLERSASFGRLGAPAGASVSADVAAVKGDTAAILVDTGTTLQAELDGIQADTEDIQARLPAALITGRMDANVGAMAANVLTATAINADAITDAKVASDVTIASVTGAVGSVTGLTASDVGAIKAKTDLLPAAPAAVGDIPTAIQNADALLKRDWTLVTGEAARSVLNALRFLRNKWALAAGTLTVTKEDDAATAWTGAVTTDAAVDQITGVDPA